ncbi:hypothetical protein PN498_17760 [Oscillatoria sp. CS-180]|uniref:hypothetical protein n=1 Tax=Oscillatoria sp. CS-180 TaxID=3021720 RepID=UPI00233120CF|nr:hypothetical protein [Oscillatoria sp. CS-180]MDB9527846.1 hypothetical protein [Oscillatoria sp. CS-180]
MSLYLSREDFALTWPDPSECLPEVGDEAPPLEGWQVERMQEFVGDRTDALYDLVLICWCVSIRDEADQTAA